MTEPLATPDDVRPINEAAAAQNADFIAKIERAQQSGPVMTPDEFKAWLLNQ